MKTQNPSGGLQLEEPPAAKLATAKPASAPAPVQHSSWDDEDDLPRSGFQKYRSQVIVAVLTVGGLVGAWKVLGAKNSGPSGPPAQTVTRVNIQPLPPPPPPPPPPEQVVQKQEAVVAPEDEPDEPDTPPALVTANTGKGGSGGMQLGVGNRGVGLANRFAAQNAALMWKRYAGQAQGRISDAMRGNSKTRKVRFEQLDVRLWPDATGRITKATLVGSTGDPTVDAAIRDEVLTGMMMPQPPPEGMPLPINLRVRAKRPN